MSQPLAPLADNTIRQLITWVRQGGKIGLSYFNRSQARYKANQTLVTEADLKIEQFLVEHFRTAFPEYGLLSEEGYRSPNWDNQAAVWAIDPLDGTSVFSQGLPGWGISIGLLIQGQPAFGMFYLPLTDDLAISSTTHRQTVRTHWPKNGFLAVDASAHRQFDLGRIPGIRALGSVGANLIYTARGAATAALLPKARLWDLVGGATILTAAGGELRYLSGASIDYLGLLDGELAPEPIIAGHPAVLDQLQQTIRRI
ncbi:MAG: inositol monophosphatase [Anaerolineaceae bacterium]|nr:inositol monophosphatase [Anaerolineaceae bacterium]MCB9101998.1 inositol monophosphatase [Anaerolineales bacterium]